MKKACSGKKGTSKTKKGSAVKMVTRITKKKGK